MVWNKPRIVLEYAHIAILGPQTLIIFSRVVMVGSEFYAPFAKILKKTYSGPAKI